MSIAVIDWVFKHSPTKGTDRLVLLAIADSAEDDGTNAWPGVDTVARKAGVTRRGAQQSIARLQREGRVRVEHQAGGPGDLRADRRPNRYSVVMTGRTVVHPVSNNGANADAARGERNDADGANGRAPYPSKASVLDPSSLFADRFEEFYAAYPKHEKKADALKAWEERVRAGADQGELVAGARREAAYVAAGGRVGPKGPKHFVKLPATWLRAGCEQDELETPAISSAPKGYSGIDDANARLGRVELPALEASAR